MDLHGPSRYDYQWKEVQDINSKAVLLVQMDFAIRGLGFLVVTWTTVVLLGGFVSMLHKQDFWRLTLITLIQILWINGTFKERMKSGTISSIQSNLDRENQSTHNWQLSDKAPGDHPKLDVVAAVRWVVGWVVAPVYNALFTMCVLCISLFYLCGLYITISLSIYGLVKNQYHGDTDEGRTNMYLAHNVLYVLCVVQGALLLYRTVLLIWSDESVNQVSQAYGFQNDVYVVLEYFSDIIRGCEKNPSFAEERNLVTYAIELMESNSPSRCLSGTLILDRLLTRQYSDQIKAPTFIQEEEKQPLQPLIKKEKRRNHLDKRMNKREEAIILQQRTVIKQQRTMIKRLIGSASSTHILQKLLQTLDSRRSCDRKMREAAARIVEHVAGRIHLEQFPQGINCISSLINNFEEYRLLQPDESSSSPSNIDEATTTIVPPSSNTNENNDDDEEKGSYSASESESEPESEQASEYSESEPESESYKCIDRPSSSKALHGYKELVLTGLRILWSLTGSEDNCRIISNTKHVVSKIMAPVNYDLVHCSSHSAWSTSVVEASMRVMLRLIVSAKYTKGETGADLCQQISNNEAITTMKKIVTCEGCKGGELQMMAMQILMQLSRCSFTKMLVDFFITGNCGNVSIRKTAGKELVMLFLSSKSVAALLPKEENDEFVGGLVEMVSQVGNEDECRKGAAEILEHMCIHYTENVEYLLHQKGKYDEYLRKKKENAEHLSTLKNLMASAMPKVLREILVGHGWTGKEGKPGTDIVNQIPCFPPIILPHDRIKKKTSSYSRQNQHHKLYVALLSLYVTACEKLHLDIDAISPGEGDQGEGVAFRFAMQMVQSNKDCFSAHSLSMIKLSTRMVIATMMKLQGTDRHVVRSADLDSLMDSLTSISETMLDLEGSMVFTAGTTMMLPSTADTLNSLVKQARQLQGEIKDQDLEIVPAS